MTEKNWSQWRKEKNQFQSYYCQTCHQRRKCFLDKECCSCLWAYLKRRQKEHKQENYAYYRNLQASGSLLRPTAPADYYLFHGQYYPFSEFLVHYQNWLAQKRKLLTEDCSCQVSPKTRTQDEWTECESCGKELKAANNMRIIKNRNDPHFWGLKIPPKILCLTCLKNFQKLIPIRRKRKLLNEYLKRGYI
jgi:hypothetical protein